MPTPKYRLKLIILILGSFPVIAWFFAAFSEAALPAGQVRLIATAMLGGIGLICGIGLAWFLAILLMQADRQEAHHQDVLPVDEQDRLLVRTKPQNDSLRSANAAGNLVFVPAPRRKPMPLRANQFEQDLYHWLTYGEDGNDHNN